MTLIRGLTNIPKAIHQTAVTLGDFDGVHLGHQTIIRRLIKEAKAHQLTSVLICFEPQPAEFFQKKSFAGRILRLREKLEVLNTFDIDYVLCLGFNKNLAELSTETFVKKILINRLHCKRLIVGNDSRMGKEQDSSIDRLAHLGKQYDFSVILEKTFQIDKKRASSTRIRQALRGGDFNLVKQLMGRPYVLCGKVMHAHGRGKTLGFPTANIPLFHYKMTTSGIFVVKVKYNQNQIKYGVANLGIRPTFHEHQFVLEVYVLDFEGDLYGKTLQVEFLHKLRDEKRFSSVDELKKQIKEDVLQAKRWISK